MTKVIQTIEVDENHTIYVVELVDPEEERRTEDVQEKDS